MWIRRELEDEIERIYNTLPADQPQHTNRQTALVKRVIEFYVLTFQSHDYVEARKLLSDDYKQHNPMIPDGPTAVFEFAESSRKRSAGRKSPEYHYKRILVDGDFVVVHRHVIRFEGDRGIQLFDMFRANDRGLFVEHWDSFVTEVPADGKAKNGNGLF